MISRSRFFSLDLFLLLFQLAKDEIPPAPDVFLDISYIIHIKINIAVTIY